jgi:orotate phosphoribosyltransferase
MVLWTDAATAAEITARALVEIEAVHARPEQPFVLTSGLASPVYIDCRKLISFPRIRRTLMDLLAGLVLSDIGFERIQAVAGGETAGIPFAAWLADRLQLPMLYVRKKPKGFGRNARIEGALAEASEVLLVEDLATDGGSKIAFAEALREAGARVGHAVVLFYYNAFPEVPARLQAHGLRLHWLATWREVLAEARRTGYFDRATQQEVERFLADPLAWSRAHGGISELPGERPREAESNP